MQLVVQRGHVPRRTGSTGAPGEQAFAIAAAHRVELHVRALGHRVRVIDADPSGSSAYVGDAFVALHFDSSTDPEARGASVGWQTGEGQHLATRWKAHYARNGWTGGFRADNYTAALRGYYGVRRAVENGTRAAFIAEAGFGSSPADRALLAEPAGPDRVAVAIAAALVDLWGCPNGTRPAPAPPTPAPPFPGTVRRGATGGAVRAWQVELNHRRRAGLDTDGVFGDATQTAVQRVQRDGGLTVDGIAGPATWHVLVFS